MGCFVSHHVWLEIGNQLGLSSLWYKPTLVDYFRGFFTNPMMKDINILPPLVSCGI